jgi:heat shock protein HslJ
MSAGRFAARRIRATACALALAVGACATAPPSQEASPTGPTEKPQAAGAAQPAGDAALSGTRWIGADAARSGADPRTFPRLEFVKEGRVSGYTGCNLLSGTWKLDQGEVRFGPIVTTKRYCLGPEGENEKRLLAALRASSRARRSGDKLIVESPGGASFEFVEAPVA